MFQNINKLLLILALVAFYGCKADKTSNSDKNITKSNIEPQKSHNKEKKDDLLHKIGISTSEDKIIIEPKKTKEFFDNLAKTLEKDAKKLEEKSSKIKNEDIGISASEDKITIDLDKTKNFLDKFSKELENIAKDIEKAIEK